MAQRDDTGERRRDGLSRRSYLGLLGGTAGTLAAGSAVGTGTAAASYDREVDIVEAGADPTGGEPIDDVFEDVARDGTLLRFPEGTYVANSLIVYQLENFAMVGEGDVTLVPGADHDPSLWIAGAETRDLRIENFTFDHRGEGVGPKVDISSYGGLVLRDVHKRGYHDNSGIAVALRMLDADAHGLVENYRAPDGGDSVGLYLDSHGPMTVRNCEIARFVDNGLYASPSTAPITVEGGTFRNNNIAQVRLGSADSSVTGATVRVDDYVPADGVRNQRGIRIADGPGPVLVEDCEITMERGEGDGGVVGAYSGGSFTVRNTRIYVGEAYTTNGSDGSRTGYGVLVDDSSSRGGTRRIENVSVTGEGTYRAAMAFRRDGNVVTNCCIHQRGTGRDGVHFVDCVDNAVTDTTIDVSDDLVVTRDGAQVSTDGIDASGSCPLPGSTSDGTDGGTDSTESSGPSATLEVGGVRAEQASADDWRSVALSRSFADPVALMKPVSYAGYHPCHVRLRDVGTAGFGYKFEEWMYLDGWHTAEEAGYAVLESGQQSVGGLPAAVGTVDADHEFASVGFDGSFDATPVVLTQAQTYRGWNPIVTRVANVSAGGFAVRLQEEDGEEHGGRHRVERVGYAAVAPGTGSAGGRPLEVGRTPDVVTDEWYRISFEGAYETPRFVADLQTYDGTNAAGLRYRNLTSTGADVFVEEDQSDDAETAHTTERVGYLVVEDA